MVKKMLMGRRIFEHINGCPGIRVNVLFGCPQQHSHWSTVSSEVLVVTTCVVPVLCLPGGSGHSLLETTQISKGVLWLLRCLMSTRNSAVGFSRGDDLKGRGVWIASTFSSVCFLLLNAYKKAKPTINSLIRSQSVLICRSDLVWVASFVLLEAFLSAVTIVKFILLGDSQIFHPHP